jgi:fibronectin-binding autotransporter adhesin
MKLAKIHPYAIAPLCAAISLMFASHSQAATLYWDGNGTGATGNPPSAGAGGGGTWDNGTTANWWTGSGYQLWNATGGQDVADFRGPAPSSGTTFTVAVSGTVSANRLDIRTSAYTFGGTGTIQMVGSPAPGVIDAYTTAPTTFNALLAGAVKLQATGSSIGLTGSAVANINGNNTGLTSLEIALNTNSNPIVINHPGAFGTSSSSLKITTGMVNLGNNAAPNNDVAISYNAVPTELAGGTIRARFNASTWNGPVTLSANSGLVTRAAANVSLTFSSTATINLGTSTLNLDVASASAGVTFGGVISGTGSIRTDAVTASGVTSFGVTNLNAANTFSGSATTVAGRGTIALGNVNALQNATLNTGASAGTQSVTFTVVGNNTYNIGALEGADPLDIGTNTLSVGTKAVNTTFSGVISGTGSLTKVGTSKLTLNAANTYSGSTSISSGTLALGTAGSLASTSNVSIAAGATFDVSALASYTHGASASLSASGTGSTPGTTAAEIKGTGTVNLGSRPLNLNFTPTSFAGDTSAPALLVSSGSLTLNGPVTVVNNGASPLGNGTYVLATQSSGTISGTPTLSGTIGGNGVVAGKAAYIQVNGSNLELVVVDGIPTTVSLSRNISTGISTTYGDTLQFDVSVSPSGATGNVELRNGGISGPVIGIGTLTAGNVTISTTPASLSAASHGQIVALYLGDSTYQSGSSANLAPAQEVSPKLLTVSGAVANNKYVDGTTNATLSGGTLSGVITADTADVTLSQTGIFASAAAGTGISVTATCSLGGAKASNYLVTQPTGLSANIYETAVWTNAAGGTWNTAGNWADSLVPNGAGISASFATLDITTDTTVNLNSPRTIGNLTFGDTDSLSAAGWILANNASAANVLTLAGSSPTVTVAGLDTTKAASITAIVAGTNGLTKEGSGTLSLGAANTFSGASVVNNGTLRIANASAMGSIANGTTVNTDGTFDFNSIAMAAEPITLAGGKLANNGAADQINAAGGAVVVNANSRFGGTKRWDVRAASSSLTINSGVNLIKEDLNIVAIVGRPFTLNGEIQIDGGAFAFHTVGTFAGSGSFTVNAGGELQLGSYGAATPLIIPSNILSNGGLLTSVDHSGAGGAPIFAGGITLASSTNTTISNGPIAANAVFSGVIDGDGNLIKAGGGIHTLTGTNTFTGSTTVNAGELRVGSVGALAATSSITVNAGGRLGIADTIVTGAGQSVSITSNGGNFFGALQGMSGTSEWQGGVVVSSTPETRIGVNTGTFTVSGVISGGSVANGIVLRPNTGTLILSAANTYEGNSLIICGTGGFVQLSGGANRLPTATKLVFGGSAVSGILDLNGQNQEVAGISVNSGTTNELRSLVDTPVLTVNTPTATPSTYTGLLTGTLGLTKKGPERLTLSGANSYAGATVVEAGTLLINGNQSSASGAVSVTGGTLGGTGTIGGDVTVSTGGSIAPGSTTGTMIGTLLVTSANLSGGGTLAIGIDDASTPKADLLDVGADLNVTGATLNVSFTGSPAEPSYTIATATSVTGTFASVNGLPSGYVVQYTATEILIVESAGGFDSWIGSFGTLADSTAGGDPDNDGMENLLEYVLNGNPAVSGPSNIVPVVDVSGANFVFSYSRREESAVDSTQVFEYSTDLVSWTPVIIAPSTGGVILGTPAAGVQTVTVTIPKGTNTSLYGRLRTQK